MTHKNAYQASGQGPSNGDFLMWRSLERTVSSTNASSAAPKPNPFHSQGHFVNLSTGWERLGMSLAATMGIFWTGRDVFQKRPDVRKVGWGAR